MKTLHRTITFALLASLAACSNDRPTGPEFDPDAFFTANVNGVAWEDNYQAGYAIGTLFDAQDRVEFAGLEVAPTFAGRQVTFILEDFTGLGVYPLGEFEAGGSWGFFLSAPDVRAAPIIRDEQDQVFQTDAENVGSVTITEWDAATGHIEGTFTFEAADIDDATQTVAVTQGAFSGKLLLR